MSEIPTWSNWREAIAVVAHPPHLRKTLRIALIVGTILFAINQLDVVLKGQATPTVWVKAVITFLVPFCVSNLGILVATRRRETPSENAKNSSLPIPNPSREGVE